MGLIFRRTVFDQDVLALDEACFLRPWRKAVTRCVASASEVSRMNPMTAHRRLLRARRERPRDGRAAERG